jgi:hypothetical protein
MTSCSADGMPIVMAAMSGIFRSHVITVIDDEVGQGGDANLVGQA